MLVAQSCVHEHDTHNHELRSCGRAVAEGLIVSFGTHDRELRTHVTAATEGEIVCKHGGCSHFFLRLCCWPWFGREDCLTDFSQT
jgi:hypothetical protein